MREREIHVHHVTVEITLCLSGGGFPAFGQAKSVATPFGQAMAGPMVSSNPFLVSLVAMCYSLLDQYCAKILTHLSFLTVACIRPPQT